MTTLTVKIPESKKSDFNSFIKQIGGEIVPEKQTSKSADEEDDEVTHEVFFGENIKRLIKAFRS
jgi:hypothetical protein